MCYICGCSNFTVDELVWYNYHCNQCGHVYESTGKYPSVRHAGPGMSKKYPVDLKRRLKKEHQQK